MNDAARVSPVTSAHMRYLAPRLLAFALIALAGNALGARLRFPEIGSALLFPPYAALAAALIIGPRRDWGWYLLLDAFAHLVTHWPQWPMSWVVCAGVANAARAVTAACLFRRFIGDRARLDSLDTLARFLLSGVLVAPAVGATLGAANVMLHGGATTYWLPWRAWFISNALTGLTMLPVFLRVFAYGQHSFALRVDRARLLESLGFLLTLLFAVAVAMIGT